MIVYLTESASRFFIKELENNNVKHAFLKGFTTIEVEDTPKARMAVRMVKEKFVNEITLGE
jgi:hypothetical protein